MLTSTGVTDESIADAKKNVKKDHRATFVEIALIIFI